MSDTPDDYRIFDRANDLEVAASWLVAHPEFEPFAESLAAAPYGPDMNFLAGEGDIADTIAAGGHDYPDLADTTVTLLLDQSGSQRGPQHPHLVSFVDRTVEALSHAGAAVEVLGFTTQRWKGGLARRKWLTAGKPPAPGRLNDLLHIVYKEPNQPWRLALDDGPSPRESFSRVFRMPYMREGIDGEAVEWATGRMLSRPQSTRIMIVCSDVAPGDDATMSVNRDGLLTDHLRRAVASAEARGVAVVSVSDGMTERTGRDDVYGRVAYETDWTRFDAGAAAAGVMARVAEIAAPVASPAP